MSYRRCAFFAIALAVAVPAMADDLTPIGTWTTYTDDHKPKSHVEIFDNGGTLGGKVAGMPSTGTVEGTITYGYAAASR